MKVFGDTIVAEDGMYCTNGINTHGRTIYLGKNFNEKDFYEITEEEYEAIVATPIDDEYDDDDDEYDDDDSEN